jgi:hypothetical protein
MALKNDITPSCYIDRDRERGRGREGEGGESEI